MPTRDCALSSRELHLTKESCFDRKQRRESTEAYRSNSVGDFAYSRISKTPQKRIELNSLTGGFPCSPLPAKGTHNAEEKLCYADSSLLASRKDDPNKEYFHHSKSQDVSFIESLPVVEDESSTEPRPDSSGSPPTEKHAKWVGIGVDGETMSLSVCSNSVDSSAVSSACFLRSQNIPKAINVQRFEPDNLPCVGEGEISTANADTFLKSRSLLTQRVLQDVEELSHDLSRLEDAESVASVITKEEAHDLSKRLGEMEQQLLDLAGETHGKTDAIRALAKVTCKQGKIVESLQKKTKKQEKKITTLTDLCQRLMHRKRQDKTAQAAMRRDMEKFHVAMAETKLQLRQSEARSRVLTSELAATTTKLNQREEESVQKSRLLLESYSNPSAGEKSCDSESARRWQAKYGYLREEGRLRAVRDGDTIRHMESQMTAMVNAHEKDKRRGEKKVEILMEMKAALEEQIQLLEGNDSFLAE